MKQLLAIAGGLVLVCQTAAAMDETPANPPAEGAAPVVEPMNAQDVLKALPVATPLQRKLMALRHAQDGIVHGLRAAPENQRRALSEMGALFDSPDYWRLFSPSDAPAVAAYVLSGGRPDVAEHAAQRDDITEADRRLLQGVAYYARGLISEADAKLKDFPTQGYPSLLAGQIAMVQGLILDDKFYDKRVSLLRLAMNQVPGTMVEEAALRRLVVLSAVKGDGPTFLAAARRYSSRFSSSLYSPEFHDSLVSSIGRFASAGNPLDPVATDLLLAHEAQGQRAEIYVGLSRLGIAMGKMDLCLYGGRRALRLSLDGSVLARRALIYILACRVVTGDREAAEALANLDGVLLSEEDVAVLKNAKRMAEAIARPPKAALVPVAANGASDENAALAASAGTAMGDAVKILRRAKP